MVKLMTLNKIFKKLCFKLKKYYLVMFVVFYFYHHVTFYLIIMKEGFVFETAEKVFKVFLMELQD